jgi:hypothetical protein
LPAEDGAEQGAERQQHAQGFEAEVDDVVGQHGDQAGHQRGLDAIPACLLPEPARDHKPKAKQQHRGRDSGLDQDAHWLDFDELEPNVRRQG